MRECQGGNPIGKALVIKNTENMWLRYTMVKIWNVGHILAS